MENILAIDLIDIKIQIFMTVKPREAQRLINMLSIIDLMILLYFYP
ncbi:MULTISPECIES: hypothetical protein [Clostridium]|uniref:Uncharacterized protein n=1 Tax=Clostridium botulinum D str. 1873 TaxID=592027 RepID=A0A9P2G5M8_CLOBO|nr:MULTISPECIES: hypothetical protein [Clostridium]EES90422.1 hypothetical protein CLG_B0041 [Clostridium botulinum D str. 1873]MBO3441597.1 hypothetical protein [Clostridium haemolyticum]QPW55034.1 hypothetical protein IRP61_07355 [Clostridium botulinum]